jgi:hypothetical protein
VEFDFIAIIVLVAVFNRSNLRQRSDTALYPAKGLQEDESHNPTSFRYKTIVQQTILSDDEFMIAGAL